MITVRLLSKSIHFMTIHVVVLHVIKLQVLIVTYMTALLQNVGVVH
jgi:hypothetical protein